MKNIMKCCKIYKLENVVYLTIFCIKSLVFFQIGFEISFEIGFPALRGISADKKVLVWYQGAVFISWLTVAAFITLSEKNILSRTKKGSSDNALLEPLKSSK